MLVASPRVAEHPIVPARLRADPAPRPPLPPPPHSSLTHIEIRPNGGISLISLGDSGHLSLEDTTFSMHQGYEW